MIINGVDSDSMALDSLSPPTLVSPVSIKDVRLVVDFLVFRIRSASIFSWSRILWRTLVSQKSISVFFCLQ